MSRPVRPELVALLDDVKQNPSDLTPWLVLTDWLEEHGDEADQARAEYCRLCFDKLGKKTYASDWEKGERRRELFRGWKSIWFGGLVGLLDIYPFGACKVQRGLLQIDIDADQLFEAIRNGLPTDGGVWIERLRVYQLTPSRVEELAASPILEGPSIVSLSSDWVGEAGTKAIAALAESAYLNQVRDLRIMGGFGPRKKKDVLAPLRERFGKALKSR